MTDKINKPTDSIISSTGDSGSLKHSDGSIIRGGAGADVMVDNESIYRPSSAGNEILDQATGVGPYSIYDVYSKSEELQYNIDNAMRSYLEKYGVDPNLGTITSFSDEGLAKDLIKQVRAKKRTIKLKGNIEEQLRKAGFGAGFTMEEEVTARMAEIIRLAKTEEGMQSLKQSGLLGLKEKSALNKFNVHLNYDSVIADGKELVSRAKSMTFTFEGKQPAMFNKKGEVVKWRPFKRAIEFPLPNEKGFLETVAFRPILEHEIEVYPGKIGTRASETLATAMFSGKYGSEIRRIIKGAKGRIEGIPIETVFGKDVETIAAFKAAGIADVSQLSQYMSFISPKGRPNKATGYAGSRFTGILQGKMMGIEENTFFAQVQESAAATEYHQRFKGIYYALRDSGAIPIERGRSLDIGRLGGSPSERGIVQYGKRISGMNPSYYQIPGDVLALSPAKTTKVIRSDVSFTTETLQRMPTGISFYKGRSNVVGLRSAVFTQDELRAAINAINENTEALSKALDLKVRRIAYSPYEDVTYLEESFLKEAKKNVYKTYELAFDKQLGVNKRIFEFMGDIANVVEKQKGIGSGEIFRNMYSYMMTRNVSMMTAANDILRMSGFKQTEITGILTKLRDEHLVIPTGSQKEVLGFGLKERRLIETGKRTTIQDVTFGGYTRRGKLIRSAKVAISEEAPLGMYVKLQGEQKAVVGGVGRGFSGYFAGIAHIIREQGSFNPESSKDIEKLINVTEKFYKDIQHVASVGAEKAVGGLYEKGFSSAEKKAIASEVTDLVSTIATNKKLAIERMRQMSPAERSAMLKALDELGYSMKFEISSLGEAAFSIYAEGGRNKIRQQADVLKDVLKTIPGFVKVRGKQGVWAISTSNPGMSLVKKRLEEAGFVAKAGEKGERVYFKSPMFEAARKGLFIDVPFLERETNVLAEKYMILDKTLSRPAALEMARDTLAGSAEKMLSRQSANVQKLYSLFEGAFGRAVTMSVGLVSEEEALGRVVTTRPMSFTNIYNLYLKGLLPEAQKRHIEDVVAGKTVGKLKKSYDLLEAMFAPQKSDAISLQDVTKLLKEDKSAGGAFSKVTRLLTDTVSEIDKAVKEMRKSGGDLGQIFIDRYGIGDKRNASFENVLKFIDEVLFSESIAVRKLALKEFFPGKHRLAIPIMNAANEIDIAGKQSTFGLRALPTVRKFGQTSRTILGMDSSKKVVAIPIDTGGTIFPSSLYNEALRSFEGGKEKLDIIAKEAALAAYGYAKNKVGQYVPIRSSAMAKEAGVSTASNTVSSLVSYLTRGLGSSTVDITKKVLQLPSISIQTLAAPSSYGKIPSIYKGMSVEQLPVYQQASVFFNEGYMLKGLEKSFKLEQRNIREKVEQGLLEQAKADSFIAKLEEEFLATKQKFISGEGLDMIIERGPGISEARAAIVKVFSAKAWESSMSDTARSSYFFPTEDTLAARKARMYEEQTLNLQNLDFDGDNVRLILLHDAEARQALKLQAEEGYGMHRKLASMFLDEDVAAKEVGSLSELVSKLANYDGRAAILSSEEIAKRRVNALEFAIKKSTEGGRKAVAQLLDDNNAAITGVSNRVKQAAVEEIETVAKGYKGTMQNLSNYVTSVLSVAAIKNESVMKDFAKIIGEHTGINPSELTPEHIGKTLRLFNELTVEQLTNIKNVGRPERIYEQLKGLDLTGPITEDIAKTVADVYTAVMGEAVGVLSSSNKKYQADVGRMANSISELLNRDMFSFIESAGSLDMEGSQADIIRLLGFSGRRKEGTGLFQAKADKEATILIQASREDKSLLYTAEMKDMFSRISKATEAAVPEDTIEASSRSAYRSQSVKNLFASMSESEVKDPAIKEAIKQAKANKESRMFNIVTEEGVGKMESKFVSGIQEVLGKYGGRAVGIGLGIGAGIFAARALFASIENNSSSNVIEPNESFVKHRSDTSGMMDAVVPREPTMVRESSAAIDRYRIPNKNVVLDSFQNSPQYDIMNSISGETNVIINNMMPRSYEINDYTGDEYR